MTGNLRQRIAAVLLAAALVAVGGCTTARDDDGREGPAVTDATGHTLHFPEPPKRIVSLEWVYTEDLLSIGVTPVGVADIKGYGEWIAEPKLPAGAATDVGTRQEPSLERIRALKPDLILGATFRSGTNREQLEQIAPTLMFNAYPSAASHLEEMRSTMTALGVVTHREADAAKVLATLDDYIAAGKAAIAAAGMAGQKFALGQAGTMEGRIGMRMFTGESLSAQLMASLGLVNAWNGPKAPYGYNEVELESIASLPDVRFVYLAQLGANVVESVFTDNPLWRSLPFVRAGHVYKVASDTWFYGGPRSAQAFVDRASAALTGKP